MIFHSPSHRASKEKLDKAIERINLYNNHNCPILIGNGSLLSGLNKPYTRKTEVLADILSPVLYPCVVLLIPLFLTIQTIKAQYANHVSKRNNEVELDQSRFFKNYYLKYPVSSLFNIFLIPLVLVFIPIKIIKTTKLHKSLNSMSTDLCSQRLAFLNSRLPKKANNVMDLSDNNPYYLSKANRNNRGVEHYVL